MGQVPPHLSSDPRHSLAAHFTGPLSLLCSDRFSPHPHATPGSSAHSPSQFGVLERSSVYQQPPESAGGRIMTTRVSSTSASPPPTLSASKDDSRGGYCWFLPPPRPRSGQGRLHLPPSSPSSAHQLIFETKPWTLCDFTENGHCILSRAFFPLSSRLANAWVPHLTSPVTLPWAWVSV